MKDGYYVGLTLLGIVTVLAAGAITVWSDCAGESPDAARCAAYRANWAPLLVGVTMVTGLGALAFGTLALRRSSS